MNQLFVARFTRKSFTLYLFSIMMLLPAGCDPASSRPEDVSVFKELSTPPPPLFPQETPISTSFPDTYLVIPGDILSIEMEQVIRSMSPSKAEAEKVDPYVVRVRQNGTIILPGVSELQVAGKSLPEVEEIILQAYYPAHLVSMPSIVARVQEYHTSRILVAGAVAKPGIVELQHNEMDLAFALMKVGGIYRDGAQRILVYKRDGKVVTLQVEHLSLPAANIVLEGGERIEVESLAHRSFNVTGLVNKPGEFIYPPDTQYNLLQALGAAGGIDPLADPRLIKITRRGEKPGELMSIIVSIDPNKMYETAPMAILPGDSLQVLTTPRTDFRIAMANLSKRIGMFFGVTYRIGD